MGLIIEVEGHFYFTFKKVGAFKNEFVGGGAGDGGVKLIASGGFSDLFPSWLNPPPFSKSLVDEVTTKLGLLYR